MGGLKTFREHLVKIITAINKGMKDKINKTNTHSENAVTPV